MAWSMPNTGQWNPGIQMTSEMNIGSYTPEQWAFMQQNWQQWTHWQQQYAQWQTQYGDKYAQQMQSYQAFAPVPPVPPPSSAPPAPPPPDKPPPPPPPHENDQPLYGGNEKQPLPPSVENANQSNQGYNSNDVNLVNNQNWSYNTNTKPEQQDPQQPPANFEALKKLAEEERLFDIQFKKWEEEIDKWRKENVNHPDKEAYKEYEQKFESCRVQLLERRQQMKQKRDCLMSNATKPASATNTGNIQKNVPLQQTNITNYSQNVPQNNVIQKSVPPLIYDKQSLPQYPQYNNMPQQGYNRNNNITVNTQDKFNPHQPLSNDRSSNLNANFLPSSHTKEIPGLDLVPEIDRSTTSKQQDIIDITDESSERIRQAVPKAPDYSTISKGINNILGDEKIMNILSMVTSQPPIIAANTNSHFTQVKNQDDGSNINNQNNNYSNRQQMSHKQQNIPAYTNIQDQGTYQNSGDYARENFRHDYPQEQFYHGHSNMPPTNVPQVGRFNAGPRPLIPNLPPQQNSNQHSVLRIERRQPQNNIPPLIPPVKQTWVEEPLFTPSVIVNYDHKPLRVKARGFIEPVHMFDYDHKSKDGKSSYKKDFDKEFDDIFTRIPRKPDYANEWNYDRRPVRDDDQQRDRSKAFNRDTRDQAAIFNRRTSDCYTDRRRDDRDRYRQDEGRDREPDFSRIGDNERERDHYRRDKDYGKDREPGRDRDAGRDKDFGRERDFGRDREFGRDRDYGREREMVVRDREFGRDRDLIRDRDIDRDKEKMGRDRDSGRDRDGRQRDIRRDDSRNRSRSRDRDSRKREHIKDDESIGSSGSKRIKDIKEDSKTTSEQRKHVVMIDDLLEPPGRDMRPSKIVIILRGPPGSGKSYLAKLIRDKEAEYGGTVRIMSIDDYFMQEGEVEETDPNTGKVVKKPFLKYEYDEKYEEMYITSLRRAFKRSLTDGYFTFLIYDAVNEHLKNYADVWNCARQSGFQVYVCTMELDPQVCFKRNIHNRELQDIEVISSRFFPTPSHHIQMDPTTLLQSASITDVQMEDVDDVTMEEESPHDEVENSFTSKWEKMDDAVQLARLDGTNKPLRPSQLSMEDYLQLDEWKPNTAKPGKKTVRWADIEESRQQEKMRAIGFVVGQTDWNRMTDPTMGSSALTQTKYIERVRRF